MALKIRTYLVHKDTLYYSTDPEHPVGSLLEGIWEKYPQNARSITRNRIFTDAHLTPLCEGMLLVVGKRASRIESPVFESELLSLKGSKSFTEITVSDYFSPLKVEIPKSADSDQAAIAIAETLSNISQQKIGAVLLDENKRVVSWGWNDHFKNRVLHAEIMAIKNYWHQFHKKIPSDHLLVSTLQPCAMCAGYLYQMSENFASLRIIYKEVDPGPFAQNSVLVPNSSLWCRLHSS